MGKFFLSVKKQWREKAVGKGRAEDFVYFDGTKFFDAFISIPGAKLNSP